MEKRFFEGTMRGRRQNRGVADKERVMMRSQEVPTEEDSVCIPVVPPPQYHQKIKGDTDQTILR